MKNFIKRNLKKILTVSLALVILASVFLAGTVTSNASGTGAGLAEWALNAYYSHWSYVYGGATPGAVDCSGLIYSYCGGERCNLEYVTPEIGYVSSGIPRVHGLGLHQPGHFGVYIGEGMAVDARDKLQRAERLRDIVVRPVIESHDLVRILALRGQDNDRDAQVHGLADLQNRRHAVHPRHHKVYDQQMDLLPVQDLNRLIPVVRFQNTISLLGQIDLDRVRDLLLVIAHKDRIILSHSLCLLSDIPAAGPVLKV